MGVPIEEESGRFPRGHGSPTSDHKFRGRFEIGLPWDTKSTDRRVRGSSPGNVSNKGDDL